MPVARGEDVRGISFKARPSGSASSPSPEGSKNFSANFYFQKLPTCCASELHAGPGDVKGWSRPQSSAGRGGRPPMGRWPREPATTESIRESSQRDILW
jgi:hypothetical protein